MNLKFILGSIIAIPLLPIMYYQGKKVRSNIPKLPEAEGTTGVEAADSEKHFKVLFLGESTIAGVGVATHDEGFCGTLSKELSKLLHATIDWKVYAKSGYTAKQVEKRIVPKIEDSDVNLIVIGLGGNDAFTLNNPDRWKADVKKLIDTLRSKFGTTPIIFANMPPIKEFPAFTKLIKFILGNLVELHGEELKKLVEKEPNTYYTSEIIKLDTWIKKLEFKVSREAFFSDGVHPSKLTYQTWAKEVAAFIAHEKLLAN